MQEQTPPVVAEPQPTEPIAPPPAEDKKISETSVIKPYKEEKFNAFLDMLRGESVHYWQQIAEILGVSDRTIREWKQHPAAKKAIRDGIENVLDNMTKAGKDDWRMWDAKAKMLGLSQIQKIDHTTKGEKIVPIMGGSADV